MLNIENTISIYTLSLSEYRLDKAPDYETVGGEINEAIKKYFLGREVAVRCLGVADHPGMTREALIGTIQELGTDRYDPERKMVCHDHYIHQGVEPMSSIFATIYDFTKGAELMTETVEDFYEGALADRGYRVRVDLVLVYDLGHLHNQPIDYGKGDIGHDCFVFKNPEQKNQALLGIINIL